MRARNQVYSSCFCLHSCERACRSPGMLACSRWTTEWTSKSVPYASNIKAWGLNGTGFHSGQRAREQRRSDGGADEHAHVQFPSERVHHDATSVSDFDQFFEQFPVPSLGGHAQLDSRKPGGRIGERCDYLHPHIPYIRIARLDGG